MTVAFKHVEVTNKASLGGLILDTADFLREQAASNLIFEVYGVRDVLNDNRAFLLREVTRQ